MGKTGYKTDIVKEVDLTQKKDDWQAFDFVTIAGITHKKSDGELIIGKEVRQKNPLLIFHQVYIVH